jgi:hypothetical protein
MKIELLTLDEIETIENILGVSIDEAFAEGKPKGKAVKVFIWISKKRTDPSYTIEQAGQLSFEESMKILGEATQKKV